MSDFPKRSLDFSKCLTHLSIDSLVDILPPFAMCKAFPCSDYYGGSVAIPDFQALKAIAYEGIPG